MPPPGLRRSGGGPAERGVAFFTSTIFPAISCRDFAMHVSSASALAKTMKPNPRGREVCGSYMSHPSETSPNMEKYERKESSSTACETPPTNTLCGL